MLMLIMWHNRFSENKNEAVEAHIPRHRDSKTKKPRHRDSKTKKPRHRDSKTKKPRHRDSKAKKPPHRVPVEFWPLFPLIGHKGQDSAGTRCRGFLVLESQCCGFLVLKSWCRGFLFSEEATWNNNAVVYLPLFLDAVVF